MTFSALTPSAQKSLGGHSGPGLVTLGIKSGSASGLVAFFPFVLEVVVAVVVVEMELEERGLHLYMVLTLSLSIPLIVFPRLIFRPGT